MPRKGPLNLLTRQEVLEELLSIRDLKSQNPSSYTAAKKKRQTGLLRRLYKPTQDATPVYFWAQDSDGLPIERIANQHEPHSPITYPQLILESTLSPSRWRPTLPRPPHYTGKWPPTSPSDLLGSANPLKETCVSCFSDPAIVCACHYPTWSNEHELCWMDWFTIRNVGPQGYGLFTKVDRCEYEPLGELTGELKPRFVRRVRADTSTTGGGGGRSRGGGGEEEEEEGGGHHHGRRSGGVVIQAESESLVHATKIDIGEYMDDWREQPKCYIDGTYKGSYLRFVNHSCEPNATLDVACIGPERRVAVVSLLRDVKAGEEITIKYGERFFRPCYCGTGACEDPPTPSERPVRTTFFMGRPGVKRRVAEEDRILREDEY